MGDDGMTDDMYNDGKRQGRGERGGIVIVDQGHDTRRQGEMIQVQRRISHTQGARRRKRSGETRKAWSEIVTYI